MLQWGFTAGSGEVQPDSWTMYGVKAACQELVLTLLLPGVRAAETRMVTRVQIAIGWMAPWGTGEKQRTGGWPGQG